LWQKGNDVKCLKGERIYAFILVSYVYEVEWSWQLVIWWYDEEWVIEHCGVNAGQKKKAYEEELRGEYECMQGVCAKT